MESMAGVYPEQSGEKGFQKGSKTVLCNYQPLTCCVLNLIFLIIYYLSRPILYALIFYNTMTSLLFRVGSIRDSFLCTSPLQQVCLGSASRFTRSEPVEVVLQICSKGEVM